MITYKINENFKLYKVPYKMFEIDIFSLKNLRIGLPRTDAFSGLFLIKNKKIILLKN